MTGILSQFRTDKTYNKTITISTEYRKTIFTATENCFVYIGLQASSANNRMNRLWLRIINESGTQIIGKQLGVDNMWRWSDALAYYMHPGEKVEYVVNVSANENVDISFLSNVDLYI